MNTKKIYLVSGIIGLAAGALVVLLNSFMHVGKPSKEENEAYQKQISEKYRIFSLPIPEQMDFANEAVPLHQGDVRERLDRELLVNTYWHSNTLLCIKRAARWFPVVEPILQANGIPEDFKYLAVIESGFTNVVSPAGASGFWQFMEATGKEYSLEISEQVDERYHVEKATQAACQYLKQAYAKYGSWAMAAASYNMGIGGPIRQMERQQQSTYWDLLLNDETGRYVYRILAMKYIMNNADQYGFVVRPSDLYAPYDCTSVTVDSTINDLAAFAKQFGVSYKDLKLVNPWLRQNYLKNKERRTYSIKIPNKAASSAE
jgi:membrane-bound lytic murein transglycosylase D